MTEKEIGEQLEDANCINFECGKFIIKLNNVESVYSDYMNYPIMRVFINNSILKKRETKNNENKEISEYEVKGFIHENIGKDIYIETEDLSI